MTDSRPAVQLRHRQRILFSLFRAAAKLGMRLKVPIDQMESLFQMAYFQEAREVHGLEMQDIATIFGKSLRTVSSLHRRFRGDFFTPERELQFRVDLAGWLDQHPSRVEGLSLAFPDAGPYRLQAALSDLVAGSLVLEEEGEYRRNPEQCSFFSESDTMQQVLGLNRQMDIIAETVWRRLLTEEGRAGAMARTFLFAMDESDAAGMQEEVLAILRSRLVAVDANATEHGVGQRHGLLVAMTGLEED